METVYQQAVSQGTVISRSILFPEPQTRSITGSLFMADEDLIDDGLQIYISLQRSLEPGQWQHVADYEWQGGSGAPELSWTGMARRIRLLADISRPVSLGMRINT